MAWKFAFQIQIAPLLRSTAGDLGCDTLPFARLRPRAPQAVAEATGEPVEEITELTLDGQKFEVDKVRGLAARDGECKPHSW